MAKLRSETIVLKGMPSFDEGLAVAALYPGHIVELTATGYQKHSVAKGNMSATVAIENAVINGEITTEYALGDNVIVGTFKSGDQFQARVAAGATAIAIGDYLTSAGDGTVQVIGADAATSEAQRSAVRLKAVEAVDNSGGASEAFINVEVL